MSPTAELKEPAGFQGGGKTENQRAKRPDLRPGSSGNLTPEAGIEQVPPQWAPRQSEAWDSPGIATRCQERTPAPRPPPPAASSGACDGRRLGTVGRCTCPRFHAGLDDAKEALGKADEWCQLARTKEDRNGHLAKLISLTQLQVLRGNVLRCF